jgi:hypothetical protein
MAIKWSDSTFSGTPELARETYRSEGGWWFTTTVDSCLNDNSIPHATIPLADDAAQTQQILSRQLDSNHIIILCIDMYYISNPPANVNYHVDKFYNTAATGWGHFFVIKGYKQMDGEFYFQIYDPYSFGVTYTDASLKGRNRFYRYSDVFGASHPWWNYAIVVGKKGQTLDVNTLQHAVDPARIRHAYGGNPQVNP